MGRREVVRQADFSFGELSPDYAASDQAAKARSLQKALNCRLLNSYGFEQRYGSRRMATVAGKSIVIEIVTTAGASYLGVIRAGAVDVYSQDGSLLASAGGAPWSTADLPGLSWHTREDTVYITHQKYWTRVLSNITGTWALNLFAFDSGPGNSILQPYYRFPETKGITMTPSARSGSITLQFNAPFLNLLHAGTRVRYGASATSMKEILINTVLDSQNATATVQDLLPPAYDVVVADATGYRVGEDVEGHDSAATGIITAINTGTNTVTVLMSNGYQSFLTSPAELLVGPFTSSLISSTTITTNPVGSTVWEEQVFSDYRGYPGDVFERSGRLGFSDFPEIPGAILLSSPGARESFDVGKGEAGDAIFFLNAEGGQRIVHCVSAANLIVLTDKKAYYVPEDEATPLAANTFSLIEVGPTGANPAKPIAVEEGVVYIEIGGNRIMGLLTTGNLTAPFQLVDLSRHGAHLVKNPVNLSMTNGNSQAPERYIFATNEDGTQTCIFYDSNPPRLGLTPWETTGLWVSSVAVGGIVYTICQRVIGGSTVYLLERLDADAQMDASTLFSSSGSFLAMTDDAGDIMVDDAGNTMLTDAAAMPDFANQTVKVIRGTEYLGEFTVGADGSIPGIDAGDGDFEAGLHFDMDPVLWPPEVQDDSRTMFARRRIVHAAVRTENSSVYTLGIFGRSIVNTRPAYDQGDDLDSPPPLRTEVRRWPFSAYEYEPCLQFGRPNPTPLTVLSVAQEVSVT